MKKSVKCFAEAGKLFLLVIGIAVLGAVLLTCSFAVPVNETKSGESLAIIEAEGYYPNVLELIGGNYFTSDLPGILDNGTDKLMLYTAYQESEHPAWYRAMDMYSDVSGSYSYYWHGYVIVLRLLGMVINYGEIRFLNFLLQLILIMSLIRYVRQEKGKVYGALLLTSYILMMPLALGFSLQFSWVFYLTYGGIFLFLKYAGYWEERNRYLYFFTAIGAMTSFFDLLTYPLLTWGCVVVWWLLFTEARQSSKGTWFYLRRVISSGLAWIWGYGGMWVSKWLFAGLLLKRNVMQTALEEVFFRSGVTEQAVWHSRLEAISVNWSHYGNLIYFGVLMSWMLWFVWKVFWGKTDISLAPETQAKLPAFILVGCSVPVWYLVLSNHTAGHHFFTYRIFQVGILSVLSVLILIAGAGIKSRKKAGIFCGFLGCVFCISLGLTALHTTEEYDQNGTCQQSAEIRLVSGDKVSVLFHPEKSRVSEYGVYFLTEDTEGSLAVKLYDSDKLIDTKVLDFARNKNYNFFIADVDWKLEDREYRLEYEVQGENVSCTLLEGLSGADLLEEYDSFTVNGTEHMGQPISCVTYMEYTMPEGREFLFLWCSWIFWLTPVLAVVVICCKKKTLDIH